MGKNGHKTPIRYMSIGEAIRRTRIRPVKRLLPAETSANWYPDYVTHYEMHDAVERREAARQAEARAYEERLQRTSEGVLAGLAEDGNIIWVGDDLAVRLDESRAELSEAASELREGRREAGPAERPARVARFAGRRSPDRFAVAAAAAGIIAVVLAGSIFDLSTGRRNSELASVTRQLIAGSTPFAEIQDGDHLEPVAFNGDFGLSLRRSGPFNPQRAEERIRDALSVRGFYDIGVSAGKLGDVYLAGNVYSKDEAGDILKIARRAMPSARVYFLHPEIHQPTGPAYFGATATPEDDVLGAKITDVTIGSPAYNAGIRAGDIVRGFDGELVPDAETLDNMLEAFHPGDRVVVRVWRDGGNQFMVVRLADLAQIAMR